MKRPPETLYIGERVFDGGYLLGVVVTVNGRPLEPSASWALRNHSPTGFEWGYSGSGPAQLALALLFDATGDAERALNAYQWFKGAIVIDFGERWELTAGEILDWVEQFEREERDEQPRRRGRKGGE